jgi:RNA polymerase sigma-70 factor, ECF subfamily
MENELKTLIQQAKDGNEKAFTILYNMYSPLIKGVIFNIMKDENIMNELLNTVFIKVNAKISTYVTDISFEAWLKTIATNTCIDYIRTIIRDRRNESVDDEFNYTQLHSLEKNGEETLICKSDNYLLDKALTMLSKKKRRAIELYYFENKSYKEISKLLSTPEGTIKSDISRAKKQLKTILSLNSN